MKQKINFIRNGFFAMLLIAGISVHAQQSPSACDVYVEMFDRQSVKAKTVDHYDKINAAQTSVRTFGTATAIKHKKDPSKAYRLQMIYPWHRAFTTTPFQTRQVVSRK